MMLIRKHNKQTNKQKQPNRKNVFIILCCCILVDEKDITEQKNMKYKVFFLNIYIFRFCNEQHFHSL